MARQIEQALNQKLNTYAAGKAIPVEWNFYNDGTEPVISGLHFRQNLLPAETVVVGIENTGANQHQGVYQVMVCGKIGEPAGPLKDEVDAVLAEFKRGQTVSYGGVTTKIESIYESQPLYSEAYVKIPVTINYKSFIGN